MEMAISSLLHSEIARIYNRDIKWWATISWFKLVLSVLAHKHRLN